jgi:hypothetical protein
MRYLISVIHDQATLATPDEHVAIDVFNDRLRSEARWVYAGGLASPGTAAVMDSRGRRGARHRRTLPQVGPRREVQICSCQGGRK